MRRAAVLGSHCPAAAAAAPAVTTAAEEAELRPREVAATREFGRDPAAFLCAAARAHPDNAELFRVTMPGRSFTALVDSALVERVLVDEELFRADDGAAGFGDASEADTPAQSMLTAVFGVPRAAVAAHGDAVVRGLRRFLRDNGAELAAGIAERAAAGVAAALPAGGGECGLGPVTNAVFWAMTEVLMGAGASQARAGHLRRCFDDVDGGFLAALRGSAKARARVAAGVVEATRTFAAVISGPAEEQGPVLRHYASQLRGEPAQTVGAFCCAAWWGGLGNTLPGMSWTLLLTLAHPGARAAAYSAAAAGDTAYLSACAREALRLRTYSVSYRVAARDGELRSGRTGRRVRVRRGDLFGVPWAVKHHDPEKHPDPYAFRPERGSAAGGAVGGDLFAWAPFSFGKHHCPGHPLAVAELAEVLGMLLRRYDLSLISPLPAPDWRAAFGVVAVKDAAAVRLRVRPLPSAAE